MQNNISARRKTILAFKCQHNLKITRPQSNLAVVPIQHIIYSISLLNQKLEKKTIIEQSNSLVGGLGKLYYKFISDKVHLL